MPGASAAPLPAEGLPVAEQLELLFEEPPAAPGRAAAAPPPSRRFRQTAPKNIAHNGAVTAPREQSQNTPESAGRAEPALGALPAAIPARCPVVGRPVCYRQDCRHYQGGGVHPEAVRRPRRRRRR